MDCPLCNKVISHPKLRRVMKPSIDLKSTIIKKAVDRLKVEGLHKEKKNIRLTLNAHLGRKRCKKKLIFRQIKKKEIK